MRIRAIVLLLLAGAVAGAALAEPAKKETPAGAGQQSALEAFKKLAGDWVSKGTSGSGQEARVSFRVTSGGSTVVETELPGTEHEMVTMICQDGKDLALTHYCALGNQPQMRAPGTLEGKTVSFKFVRCGNMKSDKEPHMHAVSYTFVDDNNLKAEWTFYQDGKPAGTEVFDMKRAK